MLVPAFDDRSFFLPTGHFVVDRPFFFLGVCATLAAALFFALIPDLAGIFHHPPFIHTTLRVLPTPGSYKETTNWARDVLTWFEYASAEITRFCAPPNTKYPGV